MIKRNIFKFIYFYVSVLSAYGTYKAQKKILDHLEVEVQMVVNCHVLGAHVCSGMYYTQVHWKNIKRFQPLNHLSRLIYTVLKNSVCHFFSISSLLFILTSCKFSNVSLSIYLDTTNV